MASIFSNGKTAKSGGHNRTVQGVAIRAYYWAGFPSDIWTVSGSSTQFRQDFPDKANLDSLMGLFQDGTALLGLKGATLPLEFRQGSGSRAMEGLWVIGRILFSMGAKPTLDNLGQAYKVLTGQASFPDLLTGKVTPPAKVAPLTGTETILANSRAEMAKGKAPVKGKGSKRAPKVTKA
jgi:hypothetical protein